MLILPLKNWQTEEAILLSFLTGSLIMVIIILIHKVLLCLKVF